LSLSRRRRRTLRRIEGDLAATDPGLSAFFLSFTARATGREMPQVERVTSWPPRMWVRLWRGRTITQRVKDWCDENWNDP
jgi:Protein of unknown function (DUF3040)